MASRRAAQSSKGFDPSCHADIVGSFESAKGSGVVEKGHFRGSGPEGWGKGYLGRESSRGFAVATRSSPPWRAGARGARRISRAPSADSGSENTPLPSFWFVFDLSVGLFSSAIAATRVSMASRPRAGGLARLALVLAAVASVAISCAAQTESRSLFDLAQKDYGERMTARAKRLQNEMETLWKGTRPEGCPPCPLTCPEPDQPAAERPACECPQPQQQCPDVASLECASVPAAAERFTAFLATAFIGAVAGQIAIFILRRTFSKRSPTLAKIEEKEVREDGAADASTAPAVSPAATSAASSAPTDIEEVGSPPTGEGATGGDAPADGAIDSAAPDGDRCAEELASGDAGTVAAIAAAAAVEMGPSGATMTSILVESVLEQKEQPNEATEDSVAVEDVVRKVVEDVAKDFAGADVSVSAQSSVTEITSLGETDTRQGVSAALDDSESLTALAVRRRKAAVALAPSLIALTGVKAESECVALTEATQLILVMMEELGEKDPGALTGKLRLSLINTIREAWSDRVNRGFRETSVGLQAAAVSVEAAMLDESVRRNVATDLERLRMQHIQDLNKFRHRASDDLSCGLTISSLALLYLCDVRGLARRIIGDACLEPTAIRSSWFPAIFDYANRASWYFCAGWHGLRCLLALAVMASFPGIASRLGMLGDGASQAPLMMLGLGLGLGGYVVGSNAVHMLGGNVLGWTTTWWAWVVIHMALIKLAEVSSTSQESFMMETWLDEDDRGRVAEGDSGDAGGTDSADGDSASGASGRSFEGAGGARDDTQFGRGMLSGARAQPWHASRARRLDAPRRLARKQARRMQLVKTWSRVLVAVALPLAQVVCTLKGRTGWNLPSVRVPVQPAPSETWWDTLTSFSRSWK